MFAQARLAQIAFSSNYFVFYDSPLGSATVLSDYLTKLSLPATK
jgi:hypothetical protein